MRRWILAGAAAAAVAAIGAAAAAKGGGSHAPPAPAAPAAEEGKPRYPAPAPDLGAFLFFATLEGLCEDALPDDAVEAVLERDAEGRYRNFVYACPVCSPVLEGFRAFAMRRKFYYARKGVDVSGGDPLAPGPCAVESIAARLRDPDPKARGAALRDLVQRNVERRIERLRLTEEEAGAWRIRFAEGMKKGMALLREPSIAGPFAHKSCPSCDGATDNDEYWK
jgi:hypothetical protein